jgi:methylglyoxal/glyoxal reductase
MPHSPTVTLNNGTSIPRLGFGVYQAHRGKETEAAVCEALRIGYRHIDTARAYRNEQDVGAGLRASGVPRDEVFITTKLWNDDQGYDSALAAFDASLTRLGLEYLDLYLLHWPVPEKRLDSWRALERLHQEKRVRAIGLSNFMVRHLQELKHYWNVMPAVNQIEMSPFLQQRDVRAHCKKLGITIEVYSPLAKGAKLADPVVVDIARRVGRSPAQVLIRWGLQREPVVLAKSVHAERIAENFAVFGFELGESEMSRLDELEEGLVTGWDPRDAP